MKEYMLTSIKRGLLGLLIFLAIGYTVVVILTIVHDGLQLIPAEIMKYYTIAAALGFWMGAVTTVYDVEEWSLLKQTVLHGILQLPYIAIAFATGWAPKTLGGRILFVLAYIAIFFIIWLCFKAYWTKKAKELNDGLAELNK